ncbi:actin-like ATPase domain-containing protein [Piromyces finnis]|uniref:Actin-like ATPase domain-containing protein n=1 Tax=Piromyces finnis TaxID=1754191 RepID=A0A1Y1UVA4_9FUNG|nr:actin-like ATPase domain-containing protein [Piromyces finnis]|eukprot:ORX41978.1 actin-like ATPase domain-containing protein [Piromyces finnis]
MNLKEDKIIVIEVGSYITKFGKADPLNKPQQQVYSKIGKNSEYKKDDKKEQEDKMEISEQKIANSNNNTKDDILEKNDENNNKMNIDIENNNVPVNEKTLSNNVEQNEINNSNKNEIEINWLFKNQKINNWEDAEMFWKYILVKKLQIDLKDNISPVLISIPIEWPKHYRENIAKIMFEKCNLPALYISEQPLMSLYAVGYTSGIVIDFGYERTRVVPILDNIINTRASQSLPIGSQDIDKYLLKLVKENKDICSKLDSIAENEMIKDRDELYNEFCKSLKESGLCELDIVPVKNAEEVDFIFKNETFKIGDIRFECFEPLFNPLLVGKRIQNVVEAFETAIRLCDLKDRTVLASSFVLTGGCSVVKGLQKRLEHEIESVISLSETSNEMQIKEIKFLKIPEYFTKMKDRYQDLGFMGASIVAKLVFMDQKFYISRDNYNESGPTIVNLK